jgi:CDP-diacylglycerol--glycerol-3-phosphate 3-phosphatidyltransferase
MVALIIGRELAVTGLRSLAYARGLVIPASPLGKIKMIAEVVAILALILSQVGTVGERNDLYVLGQVALWVVVVAAFVSAADYFRRFNVVLSPRIADITVAREQRSDRKVG